MDRSLARSLVYNMLATCYVYPDEKVCASIAEGEWITGFKDALHLLDQKNFDNSLNPFEQAISGMEEGEQSLMVREYTRLFVGACPYVIAPSYGSFYLEKEGLNSAKTTAELLHFYHEAGFTLKEGLHDLPDHIAHELEFMGTLAGEENLASRNEKINLEEVQMNFLSAFILPWVPTFCAKVVEHSDYPFYHHLANLTKGIIDFEKNYLGVPEELNFRRECTTIGRY